MTTRTLPILPLSPQALATNDGTLYVILVDGIERETLQQGDHVVETETIHLRLEKTIAGQPMAGKTIKDGRIRSDLAMSKKETVRAFEMVLDTAFAMGGRHG